MLNDFILQTTFFASTEAGFLGKTVPATSDTPLSIAAQVTNISFMGALIIHANAGEYLCHSYLPMT